MANISFQERVCPIACGRGIRRVLTVRDDDTSAILLQFPLEVPRGRNIGRIRNQRLRFEILVVRLLPAADLSLISGQLSLKVLLQDVEVLLEAGGSRCGRSWFLRPALLEEQ